MTEPKLSKVYVFIAHEAKVKKHLKYFSSKLPNQHLCNLKQFDDFLKNLTLFYRFHEILGFSRLFLHAAEVFAVLSLSTFTFQRRFKGNTMRHFWETYFFLIQSQIFFSLISFFIHIGNTFKFVLLLDCVRVEASLDSVNELTR